MTQRAAILGYPVSHTMSPALHTWWLAHYGIDGHYGAMAVPPAALKDALHMLRDRGYAGCNLTMPHKEAALALMDDHDESCLMSGAVNTVVFEDGRICGYNSDGFGFVESLSAQAPGWSGEKIVVLGTGGAARGIIASLMPKAGAFALVNRTRDKAERVQQQFSMQNAEIVDWSGRAAALRDATLVINCTSLGMDGMEALDLSLDLLPPSAVVADIVYRPLETPLLAAARLRGNRAVEGLSMLLHQGRLGFEHWFGRDPEVTPALHAAMLEKLATTADEGV